MRSQSRRTPSSGVSKVGRWRAQNSSNWSKRSTNSTANSGSLIANSNSTKRLASVPVTRTKHGRAADSVPTVGLLPEFETLTLLIPPNRVGCIARMDEVAQAACHLRQVVDLVGAPRRVASGAKSAAVAL